MDVWPECRRYHSVRELELPRLYSVYGRPGLHATLKAASLQDIDRTETDMLDLLMKKLTGPENSRDVERSLGILGAMTAFTVLASSQVAEALTVSHMRQCVGISQEHEAIHSTQYPEPALAVAAMHLTRQIGWDRMLDGVTEAVRCTYICGSQMENLGAQILLLMAADRARVAVCQEIAAINSSVIIPTIPLGVFLETLLGSAGFLSVSMTDNFKARLDGMYVRLTQFVQFFSVPGAEQVTQMFNRAGGILSQTGDLIIPVLVLKDGETLQVKATPDRMTVLLINVFSPGQASLDGQLQRLESTGKSMNSDLDYVALVLEVGGSAGEMEAFGSQEESDPRQISFAASGLRPSDVLGERVTETDSIDTAFERMLVACYDPSGVAENAGDPADSIRFSMSLVY